MRFLRAARRRTGGDHKAVACGVLVLLSGEQAAEGQTARLSQCVTPGCEPHGNSSAHPEAWLLPSLTLCADKWAEAFVKVRL